MKWQRKTHNTPGNKSKNRHFTPFASGPCGWSCVSANWRCKAKDRYQVKYLLRLLVNQLNNGKAISEWMEEQNP